MDCPFCEHPKAHKHGRTSKGSQRFRCSNCKRTFSETFDTLYYRRQVTPQQVETILQCHAEGSSLRGIARIGKRSYGTIVSVVRAASQKAQMVHNQEVQDIRCDEVAADEMWSFVRRSKSTAMPEN